MTQGKAFVCRDCHISEFVCFINVTRPTISSPIFLNVDEIAEFIHCNPRDDDRHDSCSLSSPWKKLSIPVDPSIGTVQPDLEKISEKIGPPGKSYQTDMRCIHFAKGNPYKIGMVANPFFQKKPYKIGRIFSNPGNKIKLQKNISPICSSYFHYCRRN